MFAWVLREVKTQTDSVPNYQVSSSAMYFVSSYSPLPNGFTHGCKAYHELPHLAQPDPKEIHDKRWCRKRKKVKESEMMIPKMQVLMVIRLEMHIELLLITTH